jgi:general secretion pathway protein J
MTTARHIDRRSSGFTLLELLIAVAIFAVVLAAINTVFYAAMRLRNRTALSFEEKLPLQHAAAVIQRDLAGIVVPGGTIFGQFTTDQTTGSGSLGQEGATEFYTSTAIVDDNSPWGEVQKVSYLLVNPTNQTLGKDLVRSITRNLLPPETTSDDQSFQQWLMSGVESLTFLYYDGTQWIDSWDSTQPDTTTGLTNNLPKAIKVQIQLASEESNIRRKPTPVELVVPIVVQARTNQTSTATAAGTGGGL